MHLLNARVAWWVPESTYIPVGSGCPQPITDHSHGSWNVSYSLFSVFNILANNLAGLLDESQSSVQWCTDRCCVNVVRRTARVLSGLSWPDNECTSSWKQGGGLYWIILAQRYQITKYMLRPPYLGRFVSCYEKQLSLTSTSLGSEQVIYCVWSTLSCMYFPLGMEAIQILDINWILPFTRDMIW